MGNKKIPKIRFNNSKIDWQQVKFKNLLNSEEGIRRGPFGSALKKELFVQNSEYVVYEQQNAIYDHFNTRYRISEEKYHELKKFILSHGDFIMSGAGTIGKISLVPEGIEKGVFNQALIRLRVNRNTDKEFFLQWMRSPEMQNKLTKANPASAMVNLVPMSEVKEWEVIVPSLDEQSAIGSLFRTLDDLLARYKVNLANYQSLKATMLSKMFPKAGKTVPEIRLDGFEGEWEKDTLEPYLTESRISGDTGLTAKKITVKLWGKGVIEKEEKYAGSSNTQYFIRKAGQFIYSKLDFQNQAFGIIPNELDGYQSTLDLPTFDIQNIDTKFLLEYVMRREFYEYQGLIANGSRKAKRIHPEDFLVMPVRIPSLEEQQAIGTYFSNLDNLIAAHQDKISHLETLKKKLLQDMFI
ncbi:type I restriction modification DNA specificity domain protein [Streptococcus gordonii]|uniref:restriction endonuclease subunit S n=1 Tax=Streptococcus gordonii TaxID=1302 RepID=UPI001D1389EC|nr:restriction endonuclease subunit S [Streptococcus gordonii]MCC3175996.1 type I restriction modification DNA specificity domain protein [Streptococcus gordonii]MCY7167975.1 restriction endonuclease subunit S [Streptococcus gordonii]